LLSADDKTTTIKDSGDRNADIEQNSLFAPFEKLPAISSLNPRSPAQAVVRYAFRSFDRQYLLADNRVISRPRP